MAVAEKMASTKNQTSRRIKVLLVDDSRDYLLAATSYISGFSGVEVVGWASSGEKALEKAKELKPDLVMVDLAMPVMNGLDTTRALKALPNPPFVTILTLHDDPEYRQAAKAVNADSFIGKAELVNIFPAMIHALFPEEVESQADSTDLDIPEESEDS